MSLNLSGDLCQPDEQKSADSILCFLIPKTVRQYLSSYSRCLSEEDRQEVSSYGNIERRLSVSAARVVLRFAICAITNPVYPAIGVSKEPQQESCKSIT